MQSRAGGGATVLVSLPVHGRGDFQYCHQFKLVDCG